MRRYATALLIFSIVMLILGVVYGKINAASFNDISLAGILFAIVKALIVVLILVLAIATLAPAFLIDILLFFLIGYDFPLVRKIWEVCWEGVAINWFWTESSGSSLFFALLILMLVSIGGASRRW